MGFANSGQDDAPEQSRRHFIKQETARVGIAAVPNATAAEAGEQTISRSIIMSDKSTHIVFPLFKGMTPLDFVAPYQDRATAGPAPPIVARHSNAAELNANAVCV